MEGELEAYLVDGLQTARSSQAVGTLPIVGNNHVIKIWIAFVPHHNIPCVVCFVDQRGDPCTSVNLHTIIFPETKRFPSDPETVAFGKGS